MDDQLPSPPSEPILEGAPTAPLPAKPRVWPSFAIPILAIGVGLTFQGIVMGVSNVLGLDSPLTMLLAIFAVQLAFGITPLAAAKSSNTMWKQRLGLVRGRMPLAGIFLLIGAAPCVWTLAVAALFLIGGPSGAMEEVGESLQDVTAMGVHLPFIFFAVLPGICEELLFRGYMQTRFVQRWGPSPRGVFTAIAVTALLFGLVHGDPKWMVVAWLLGMWMGFVAWSTRAVWTSMICHAANNAIPFALALLVRDDVEQLTETQAIALGGMWIVSAVCFVAAVNMLRGILRQSSTTISEE